MESNLFKYVWRHSRREQIGILFLVLASIPFYFLSLDLPKSIVNEGIQGQGFEGFDSTLGFLKISLPYGEWLTGAPVVLFDGFQLTQEEYLLTLSFAFLALVFVNGGFKFVINTRKGRMGERMLRRLRFELTDRILRFPFLHMRRVKQAEVATMIKDEVEPLGGFIGDAFVTPAYLGTQAMTAMAFILVQNIWLGLVAATIVGIQAFLIPKLRKRILVLGKERQLTARQLAGRIGELVDGSVEVHAHDTSNFERADIAERLGRIFMIRFDIYQRKFFVKFLNNFLAQVTPFAFYAGGGLLALAGELDIGALVAVIAAYKDLPGPIKELIDWDQRRLDVQIKYEQVILQFQPPDLLDPALQDVKADPGDPLTGSMSCSSVSLIDETNTKLVDGVSFEIAVQDHVAVVGNSSSGKEHLALLLARLVQPNSGMIAIGGRDLKAMPEAVTGRRIGYVGQDAYLFPGSVFDSLIYGLKHEPHTQPEYDEEAERERKHWDAESRRAGNTTLNPNADWIDLDAVGAENLAALQTSAIEALDTVDMTEDVYRLGLKGSIDPERDPEIADGILRAREALLTRLAESNASNLVVRFDSESYNRNATFAENLLFGTPKDPSFRDEALAENPVILESLREENLYDKVIVMGESIAKTLVELLADLPPGHPFFEQFGFINEDDLPEYRALIGRIEQQGLGELVASDREMLLGLPFKYIEARHRMGLIDDVMETSVVEARKKVAERLAEQAPDAVEFYQADGYNAAASLQDNVLFGRLAYGQAEAEQIVGQAMTEVLNSLGLHSAVLKAGLGYDVGIGGKRLTKVQRQKLGIARALLKKPDLLIVNEAASVMDAASQNRLMENILKAREGAGVIWTLQRAEAADRFDRVLVMRAGRLVEQGKFQELKAPGSVLGELIAAG